MLLALHLGRLKDEGRITAEQVSFGKLNNIREAIKIARECRTIMGAAGITLEWPMMRHANNLESVLTYEGTSEVHQLVARQGADRAGRLPLRRHESDVTRATSRGFGLIGPGALEWRSQGSFSLASILMRVAALVPSRRQCSTTPSYFGENRRHGCGETLTQLAKPFPCLLLSSSSASPLTSPTSLRSQGITDPTPIQTATLPDSIAGRDVLGRGRTGSGKTLAFLLPLDRPPGQVQGHVVRRSARAP